MAGIGLKLHPDFVFVNLYYWLLGESHFFKMNCGLPLPLMDRYFANDSGEGSAVLVAEARATQPPNAGGGQVTK